MSNFRISFVWGISVSLTLLINLFVSFSLISTYSSSHHFIFSALIGIVKSHGLFSDLSSHFSVESLHARPIEPLIDTFPSRISFILYFASHSPQTEQLQTDSLHSSNGRSSQEIGSVGLYVSVPHPVKSTQS